MKSESYKDQNYFINSGIDIVFNYRMVINLNSNFIEVVFKNFL